MQNFTKIKPEKIPDNTFKLIGSEWMLITAGNMSSYNMMAASGGGFGVFWMNICWCVIRPCRYTYEFVEKNEYFTFTFFEEKYRNILNYLGEKSGRDVNKMEIEGLTPILTDNGSIAFEEARMIIECKKNYYHDINPDNFIDSKLDDQYPKKDYHRMYVGEILNCYVK